MALWICEKCRTAYSVDAPACPHCGSSDYRADYEPERQATPGKPAAPPVKPAKTGT